MAFYCSSPKWLRASNISKLFPSCMLRRKALTVRSSRLCVAQQTRKEIQCMHTYTWEGEDIPAILLPPLYMWSTTIRYPTSEGEPGKYVLRNYVMYSICLLSKLLNFIPKYICLFPWSMNSVRSGTSSISLNDHSYVWDLAKNQMNWNKINGSMQTLGSLWILSYL